MTASPAITSLNAGELSPLLDGRTDFNKYASGCKTLVNFIPTVQGPIVQREGTHFVAEGRDAGRRVWLHRFEFSVEAAYVLEFGWSNEVTDGYIRFYAQHGRLVSGATPVQVATPYGRDRLFDARGRCRLRVAQSGDVLYITHPDVPPYILQRVNASSFVLSQFVTRGGPFPAITNASATWVSASAAEGSVTLTTNGSFFSSAHVGRLILLESPLVNAVTPWEPAKVIDAVGDLRRVGSRVYRAVAAGTTGSLTPVHTSGSRVDGAPGVTWEFLHAGFGTARITAFTSFSQVTATVEQRLPHDIVSPANTTRWQFDAWSFGHPTQVCFFRDRLVFARGNQVWMSVASDFVDFSARNADGEVTTDMAINVSVQSTDLNAIQWLVPVAELLCGTAANEFTIGELANGDPIGPDNTRAVKRSKFGSAPVVPIEAGQSVIFAQRAGRKLREVVIDDASGYQSIERTTLAEHITRSGVVDMDYAQETDSVVWVVMADGRLAGFTWNAEQNVWAWHSHDLSGKVESVAVIPSPAGDRDEVWFAVRRVIGGVERVHIEFMERRFDEGDAPTAAFYVDGGLAYAGDTVSTVSGLGHLEGREVAVHADGAPQPRRVVTGGAITLDAPASQVVVGLPMTAVVCPMRIDAGAANGTAQGKTKRLHKVVWRFRRTVTGRAGPALDQLEDIDFRQPEDLTDTPLPLIDGDKLMAWPGGYDSDGWMYYVNDSTLPATIVAIYPQLVTNDAR